MDLKEGDSFGELSLILPTQKRATATAIQQSTLWTLTLESYAQLKMVAPIISLKLIEAISQKLGRTLNEMVTPPKLFASSGAGAVSLQN